MGHALTFLWHPCILFPFSHKPWAQGLLLEMGCLQVYAALVGITGGKQFDTSLCAFGVMSRFAHHTDIFSISSKNGRIFWRTLTSISLGFCYSIFVTGVTKTACHLRFGIFETEEFTDIDVLYFEARLQAIILFMACMLTLVWLGSDYEDRLDTGIQLLIAAVKRTLQWFLKWWISRSCRHSSLMAHMLVNGKSSVRRHGRETFKLWSKSWLFTNLNV